MANIMKTSLLFLLFACSTIFIHAQEKQESFTDTRDNHSYETIKIGEQIWFAENLSYDSGEGATYYDNNPKNGKKYGMLYTYKAALDACPACWHLPSEVEWDILIAHLGGSALAGGRMKSKKTWDKKILAEPMSGFNAVAAGLYELYR
jgi:uncharacterized protein (TIGR02145 family)